MARGANAADPEGPLATRVTGRAGRQRAVRRHPDVAKGTARAERRRAAADLALGGLGDLQLGLGHHHLLEVLDGQVARGANAADPEDRPATVVTGPAGRQRAVRRHPVKPRGTTRAERRPAATHLALWHNVGNAAEPGLHGLHGLHEDLDVGPRHTARPSANKLTPPLAPRTKKLGKRNLVRPHPRLQLPARHVVLGNGDGEHQRAAAQHRQVEHHPLVPAVVQDVGAWQAANILPVLAVVLAAVLVVVPPTPLVRVPDLHAGSSVGARSVTGQPADHPGRHPVDARHRGARHPLGLANRHRVKPQQLL